MRRGGREGEGGGRGRIEFKHCPLTSTLIHTLAGKRQRQREETQRQRERERERESERERETERERQRSTYQTASILCGCLAEGL